MTDIDTVDMRDWFQRSQAGEPERLFDGEFASDVVLNGWQREQLAADLEQTYSMNFGMLERQESAFYRLPAEAVARTEPAAVFWRDLAAVIKSGKPARVKARGMSKADRVRVSALLSQSAGRAAGRAGGNAVAEALRSMTASWDAIARVRGSDQDRYEVMAEDAARAESRSRDAEEGRVRQDRRSRGYV